jgi:hypothetical protein
MSRVLRQLSLVCVAGALVACSKKAPEPQKSVVPSPAAQAKAQAAAEGQGSVGGDGKLDPNDPKHGQRKLMGLDTPVFVDGVEVAVLRYGDMAPIKSEELEGGARRYRLYDYLKSIGVAPESIKSVHVHANNDRIGSVEGSELLKDKDRFKFQFVSGDTGAPLARWETDGLKNEFSVHEIRKMTIYVKKPSPAIHPEKQCHVGPDGDCSDAIPYATGDAAKGTRVYVDGKMVGFVKRRQIGEALAMGDTAEGEHKFSVAKLVTSFGVDASGIKAVELVAGDDVIARANDQQWSKLAPTVYFTLPKHNHGKVRVHVPAEIQAQDGAKDRDALVSSVLVYKSIKPASRELSAISEDTDMSVMLASSAPASQGLGRGER